MTNTTSLSEDDLAVGPAPENDIFSDHHRYADLDDWNAEAQRLHGLGPIHRIERQGVPPFWAVVGFDAVREIESQPAVFTNAPRVRLATNEQLARIRESPLKTLIHMDGEEHVAFRDLTADWFKLDRVRGLSDRLTELSHEAIATLEANGGSCDFATEVAMPYPLQAVLKVLGLPESDYDNMLTLTQDFFGEEDPDFAREEAPAERRKAIIGEFTDYFINLRRSRQESPTDDLASAIANGLVKGSPISDLEAVSYYVLIATAGHDTTSSTMSGGLEALIHHPDQMRQLQADPSGIKLAVEEMIRWTSPVRHFMRTAQQDTEVQGVRIAKGDWLCLSFRAANFDPNVFEDPLRFDVTRKAARKQMSFGFGAHVCLGNTLARNELVNLFTHLLERLDTVELAGTPTISKTTCVGGHKTLPISYSLKPANEVG